MSRHVAVFLAILSLVVSASCGSTGATAPTPTQPTFPVPTVTPQIAGTWTGPWTSAGWRGLALQVDLTQSGDVVTGTWKDTVAVGWKGTISGTFTSPGAFSATVTWESHGRYNLSDKCAGAGTYTWTWDTRTGMSPMTWTGGFTWTGGDCGPCPNGDCIGWPEKATWALSKQ